MNGVSNTKSVIVETGEAWACEWGEYRQNGVQIRVLGGDRMTILPNTIASNVSLLLIKFFVKSERGEEKCLKISIDRGVQHTAAKVLDLVISSQFPFPGCGGTAFVLIRIVVTQNPAVVGEGGIGDV